MTKGEGTKVRDEEASSGNMKLALYRKYRPTTLDQVVGQPQVTDILAASAAANSFAHAYLFTGQRGTGKTTVARILAHLINGLDYNDNINSDNVDIIEIDAASNNGVDDVREIRDSVQLAPMSCSHKVYIIDEFHMLSKPAFNALLKTIEEPPEYVVFILATTELQKVPATILSRVQRFHFKPLPAELLASHLRSIADQEKIKVDDDALLLIAKSGGGSVRDSITLLDQLSGGDKITVAMVNSVLGLVSSDQVDQLIDATIAGDYVGIINDVDGIIADGTSPTALAEQLIKRLGERAITDQRPDFYTIIGSLLDVAKSGMPDAKLLSVLIGFNLTDVKSITSESMAQPPQRPSKPKKTAADKPAEKVVDAEQISPTKSDNPKSTDAVKMDNITTVKSTSQVESTNNSNAGVDDENSSTDMQSNSSAIKDFVWNDVLQQTIDQDRPSAHSLLEKCDYRYDPDSNTLTLFFGKPFHRKRAKSQGFNDELTATLKELYDTVPIIEISDESAPADSDVAAVLNLVGGEVTTITDGTI